MKIALDARALTAQKPAGKEKFVINILEELFKIDKENHYLLYSNCDFEQSLPKNFSKKIIRVPSIFWHFVVVFDLLFRNADVFLAPTSYIVPTFNLKSKNIVFVYDLCVFLSKKIKIGSTFKTRLLEKFFLRPALRNAKKIVVISENTKSDLIKNFKIDPLKISVIYPGVTKNFSLTLNNKKQQEIYSKYNLPEKFVLFVGTLEPRKNLARLIEAYHRLNSNFKNQITKLNLKPKLIIVGKKGWFYQEIFETVKKFKLEEMVIFTGYVPDEELPYLYKTAICFVYPSLYEGFGLPILEAMAYGCPVIASNLSSLPEVAGNAAILINPYAIDEIADALQKILSDENLRQNLRGKGLQQVQKFSWTNAAKQILEIIQSL